MAFANASREMKQIQQKGQNNDFKTIEENDKRREEEEDQRTREKDKALHVQRRTLQKLEAVLDTPILSNNVAKLRQQFDTPKEVPYKLRPRKRNESQPPINRSNATTTTDENSRDSTTKNNSRFDRRSKSTCRPLIPKNY
uniref:Uncharacterized protein n=1 Tax=Panagrolaimus davidi TaxID=227884 RepID=A0A914PF74_9BILA